jgi:hypothetical protein
VIIIQCDPCILCLVRTAWVTLTFSLTHKPQQVVFLHSVIKNSAMSASMTRSIHIAQRTRLHSSTDYSMQQDRVSSLLDLLVVRELGIGGARVRAKPFRRVQLRRTTRPLREAGSPRDHFLTNDLGSVENEQIWAVNKATSADIVLV